ncbi:hypothetical protein [Chromatocurvus halotolerans]|uniref:Uncharacterized protein n=1 Tax=Chromatocurvus halotolerans TaxID=1132028 RepID=A0A4V2SAI2_9GAMM|nr:hypothetical protein [Chromatocurvus halotolerans]TCO70990.1 hypothetical protein EV688_1243 [Chromatocurvus halotolerans]
MTDRALEITEMGIRSLFQAIWFAALSAICIWWGWPFWEWGLAGFPEHLMPEGWQLLAYALTAFLGVGFGLRAFGAFFLQLMPFLLARLLQPKPARIKRRS